MFFLTSQYASSDWCLFLDSSASCLKAALIHRNNDKPTIPIAYSTMEEIEK